MGVGIGFFESKGFKVGLVFVLLLFFVESFAELERQKKETRHPQEKLQYLVASEHAVFLL